MRNHLPSLFSTKVPDLGEELNQKRPHLLVGSVGVQMQPFNLDVVTCRAGPDNLVSRRRS